MGTPVRLNRRFTQNPHELYDALRKAGPVAEVVAWGGVPAWLVTRYDEARQLLADDRLGKSHAQVAELVPAEYAGSHTSPLTAHMLNSDPPDHTRLRRLVTKAFTAKAVSKMRPEIEEIADDLIAALDGLDTTDLIESFALPLPIRVIGALLGLPVSDRDRLREWMEPFVAAASEEHRTKMEAELTEYLRKLIETKRKTPDDGLVSALVAASDDGDKLSAADLLSMVFLLIFAGYETTVNLIGNSVLALLREPSQLDRLRADPSLIPAAVEEVLRLEGSVNIATTRYTKEPVTVGETTIPANEIVLISLISANRDESRFEHSAELDIHRANHSHLAFGHGIHYCIGAPLARMEGEIAVGHLLKAFPGLALDPAADDLEYRLSIVTRALKALPVRLR